MHEQNSDYCYLYHCFPPFLAWCWIAVYLYSLVDTAASWSGLRVGVCLPGATPQQNVAVLHGY